MQRTNWFALMEAETESSRKWYLQMDDAAWKKHVKQMIRNWRGDLRVCFNRLDKIDAERAADAKPVTEPAVVVPPTPQQITFSAWKDMIEEPYKYSEEDWLDWLEWTAELESSPGRWRVAAYLQSLEDKEFEIVRNRAATAIQASVRGHKTRTTAKFRDCCMCLAHRVCPLHTDVGMMCRECAAQGPYAEETGPLADPWSEFRADYA